MRASRHRLHAPATAAVTLSLVSALALAACTTEPSPKELSPAESISATAEPTDAPVPDGPPVFEAGTATPTEAKTVTGTGPATINFSIEPMFPVWQFTCADCTGEVAVDLTVAEPAKPMWRTTGPIDGAWLSAPGGAIAKPNSIDVDANGTWTMTIADVSTLPTTSGPQSGHGPAVLKFDQTATQLDYTFTPYDEWDFAAIHAYDDLSRETAAESIHGTTSGTLDVTLPATVFIRTDGDWTITPR